MSALPISRVSTVQRFAVQTADELYQLAGMCKSGRTRVEKLAARMDETNWTGRFEGVVVERVFILFVGRPRSATVLLEAWMNGQKSVYCIAIAKYNIALQFAREYLTPMDAGLI